MGVETRRRKGVQADQAPLWQPRLTVACGQFRVGADLARNRRMILAQMDEAAERFGANILVTPETALSGYAPAHWDGQPERIDFDQLAGGLAAICTHARKRKMAVALGTTVCERGRYYNSALIVSSRGAIVARYDKVHLMGALDKTLDAACYQPGKGFVLAEAAGATLAPLICVDVRFPEPWRLAASSGARVFVHLVAAFGFAGLYKTKVMGAHLVSRAAENCCWLASANAAGPFQFCETMIVDPDGQVLVKAEMNVEQVIAAKIDPDWSGRGRFLEMRRAPYRALRPRKGPSHGSAS